jgi:hypothetical protein
VDIMAGALQGRLQAFPVGEDYKTPSGVTVRTSLFAGGDADGVQAHVGMTVINNEFRDICQGTNSDQHTDNVQMVFGATGFVFNTTLFTRLCRVTRRRWPPTMGWIMRRSPTM